MDKSIERVHLARSFGHNLAGHFVDSERPDFLLSTLSGRTLGVEVTSTYSSQTAAKLLQLPGYLRKISTDPSSVHRRDIGQLEILKDATLTSGDESITSTLVRQIVAPMPELLRKLCEQIGEKEAKVGEYNRRASVVDPIIADDQGLFHWASPLQFAIWLCNFLPKARILGSGFREIYLNTVALDVGDVSAALKGSYFFNDCVAYSKLVRREKLSDRHFFGCLALEGYEEATAVSFMGYNFARYGPWIFDGTVVQDIRQDLRDDPCPRLKQVLDGTRPEDVAKIRQLVSARKDLVIESGVLLVAKDEN